MKTIVLFFMAIAMLGFGENIILDNQSSHPIKADHSKIAIQWAFSAKELEESTQEIDVPGTQVQTLTQAGKIEIKIPYKAEYFRILVWSKGKGAPDLLTNWLEIVPNKTYLLKSDHLFSSVLLYGMGC